jgi:hypothetical protein
LVVGSAALWAWEPLIEIGWLESTFAQIIYLAMLMIAPVVGASAVTYLQKSAPDDERHQVLTPYVWWAVSGVFAMLLLVILGTSIVGLDGFVPRSQQALGQITFLSLVALMYLVPVVVPLFRAIMWLVSPPAISQDESEERSRPATDQQDVSG